MFYWQRSYDMPQHGFAWGQRTNLAYPAENIICPKCGIASIFSYLRKYVDSFSIEIDQGTKYPDLMGCGTSAFTVVSQHAIDSFKKWKITGWEAVPVQIGAVKAKKLKEVEPPQYYSLLVEEGIQYDKKKMEYRSVMCNHCGRETVTHNGDITVVAESWNGKDLFKGDYMGFVLCTEKVLECAKEEKLSNFSFIPLKDINKEYGEREQIRFKW